MTQLKVPDKDTRLAMLLIMAGSLFFGIWQDSATAGIFMFATWMTLVTLIVEGK